MRLNAAGWSVLVTFLLVLTACGSAPNRPNAAQPKLFTPGSVSKDAVQVPELWFVEFEGDPGAGGNLSAQSLERQKFRLAAQTAGIRLQERRAFGTLFNGLSVKASALNALKLSQLPEVKAVYPVLQVQMPEVQRTEAQPANPLGSALEQTGVDVVQKTLGLTGKGVKVGVIDTGIDLEHPDFAGRLLSGYAFVDNAFTGGNTPTPGGRPDDCAAHGTHVAGIIGAKGKVTGVAPDAQLAPYKIFGCQGPTNTELILAALERAFADRMDVVNLSLGTVFEWPNYPTAEAASRLAQRGVVVVASMGNAGAGTFAGSVPALGENVIAVASYDNITIVGEKLFTVSPDNLETVFKEAIAAAPTPKSGSLSLVRTGTATAEHDACAPLAAGSLSGKAVLIRRSSDPACFLYTQSLNAQNAGAAAVVVYNNVPNELPQPSFMGRETPITIPVVLTTAAMGEVLDQRVAGGNVTLTWTDRLATRPNPSGNLISYFSSFGLSPDLTLKPDIGAPGGFIYSTVPLELGGYTTLSGTSMASPHVAGMAALLIQAQPGIRPQHVRTILQNTALPQLWSSDPKYGELDYAFRQGAGLANMLRAATTTTLVQPSRLSLGESAGGRTTFPLTVTNTSSQRRTYTLAYTDSMAASGATTDAIPTPLPARANVTFGRERLAVEGGNSATFPVTITPDAELPDRTLYGGYIEVWAGDTVAARVPFAGFKGDYQSIQVLTPTPNGYPWLAKAGDTTFDKQPEGTAYTLAEGDMPIFLAHLDHQAARLVGEVYDADSRFVGRAFDEQYLQRAGFDGQANIYIFDGTVRLGYAAVQATRTVPNGTYWLKLRVLKALGNPTNPAHWEEWQSPRFSLARP